MNDRSFAVPRVSRAGLRPLLASVLAAVAGSAAAQAITDFDPHGGRASSVVIAGSGFTGATGVSFGGVAATEFTVDNDAQISAVAPTSFPTGPISVNVGASTATSQFNFVNRAGPVTISTAGRNSLPLGVLFNVSPLVDNAFGQPGGVTYSFENMPLPGNTWVYFGTVGSVGISMNNDQPSGGEIMVFSAADSDLANGVVVYRGNSSMNLAAPWPQGNTVCTRLRLVFQPFAPSARIPLMDAVDAGIPAAVGAVGAVPPGAKFQLSLHMEAAYTSNGCSSWQPALQLYDEAPTVAGQLAYSTYSTGFYYENTRPELSQIADQMVADGGSTPSLPLAVADAETGASGVTFEISSSDTAFVPVANVSIGGAAGARTVDVATVAGQAGPSTITIRGLDSAGLFSEEAFAVSVNQPPTISAIAGQLTQVAQATAAIAFTVGDDVTGANDLILSADSSNDVLVPDANLVLGGSGTDRTLVATPFGSQTGQTTITLTVEDALGAQTTTSFVLTVNAKPVLTTNVASSVNQGGSVTLTSANLNASDAESAAGELRFTLNPNGTGTSGIGGSVRLSGAPLGNGGSFTLQNLLDGLVSFNHDDSCTAVGEFNFDVDDGDGGFARAPLSPFRAAVNVTLRNDPPVADPLSLSVGLGASSSGQVSGQDDDCLVADVLSFSHVVASGPSKGTLTSFDSSTGEFTYQAAAGQAGVDSFQFEVDDGTNPPVAALVSITIENQAPTAIAASETTRERVPLSATLGATDPDLPDQEVGFSIVAPPTKGNLSAFDPVSGSYTYTPDANRMGRDVFAFTASDGSLTSAPAEVEIDILPVIDRGDIAVAGVNDLGDGHVVLVDPLSGDQVTLSEGNLLIGNELSGIAFDVDGSLVTTASDTGAIFRVSTLTGAQSLLSSTGGMALGVHVDGDRSLLVATGPGGGVQRRDAVSGALLETYSGAQLVAPTDVDVLPNGDIVVSDAGVFASASNRIQTLDPDTGVLSDLGVAGLVFPVSVANLGDGRIAVGDGVPAFGATPSTVKIIDVDDGSVAQTISGALLDGVTGLAVDENGNLFSTSRGLDAVLLHDLVTGTPATLASGLPLRKPWGIAVFTGLRADLEVAKDNGLAQAQDGTALTYSIVAANAGPEGVTGATLADTLPAELVNPFWTCRQDLSTATCPTPASGAGSFSLAVDLAAGQWLRIDVTAVLDASPGSVVSNTATITVPPGIVDPDLSNNASTDEDPVLEAGIIPDDIFEDGFEAAVPRLKVRGAAQASRL